MPMGGLHCSGAVKPIPGPQDFSPWSREAPGMDERTLPTHAELPVRDDLPPGSSWGVWGDHDVLGTLNLLTPERVLAAARSIRTGRTFGLNLELTLPDPPLFRRAKFRHEVTNFGMTRMIVHDDLYHDWNTQSSSQWDGFRHVGTSTTATTAAYPTRNTACGTGPNAASSGGRCSPTSTGGATAQGRPLAQGDRRLDHRSTTCCRASPTRARRWRPATCCSCAPAISPGTGRSTTPHGTNTRRSPETPGLTGADYPARLWDLHVAALAADNPAVEPIPPGDPFLHTIILPLLGVPLGELWDLDALADDCAASRHLRRVPDLRAAQHARGRGDAAERHRDPLAPPSAPLPVGVASFEEHVACLARRPRSAAGGAV